MFGNKMRLVGANRREADAGGARRRAAPDREVALSLFDGDWLNRIYARLRLSRDARFGMLKRCVLAVVVTWVPIAVLALYYDFDSGGLSATNFFADFAAYVQLIIALPLFILTEPLMNARTREVGAQFVSCGIIGAKDRARLYALHAQIARLRTSYWPDLVCILFAYTLSLVILVPEFGPDPNATWHVGDYAGEYGRWRTMTPPGAWAFLVALPILNYTWLRLVWKVMLWIFYLWRVTRMRLDLHPTHPDLTGGIGFISDAQGQFALFILAYGISNIAAPVGYEIVILDYDIRTMTVWGPLVGFGIGAPLLFTLPLFMFTSQLYRDKQRALATYRERVTERSRRIESGWLREDRGGQFGKDEIRELTELNTLSAMFTHVNKMRVVPFDLRSFGQLMGSSFGSVATLLPLLHFDGQITKIFEMLGKLFGHLGG